jgi:integrase
MKRLPRGSGRIYSRSDSLFLWMRFTIRGREYRESTGATTEKAAVARMEERKAELRALGSAAPPPGRVTVSSILDDFLARAEENNLRSAPKLKYHAAAVRSILGNILAADLTTDDVKRYTKARLAAGRMPATVKRELEALRRAYRIAHRCTPPKVTHIPEIPLPRVENAREGFVKADAFAAILAGVANTDVVDFLEWFWWTGMRPSESRRLTWDMLDRADWTLTIPGRDTKTRHARTVALEGPLREIIARRLQARRLGCPYIFHKVSKGVPGSPISHHATSTAWAAACTAAGFKAGRKVADGLCPYDLRRSAVRNLVRAGNRDGVVMAISGHRTRAMLDRYNITDATDIRDAMRKAADYVNGSLNRTETARQDEEPPLFIGEVGSSGRIRTYNPPVNSRMLYP